MNKSAKTWLLFIMIPFFIGVIIYFLVPLLIIVASNPKLEGTFNGYKIQVQQNTVRALSFLNSRVTTNRIQMYRNIMSSFINIISRDDINNFIDIQQDNNFVHLNNAYEIVKSNISLNSQNSSMWYSPNFTKKEQIFSANLTIYNAYLNAEPYLSYIFYNGNQIFSPISKIITIVNQSNFNFYFQYPSNIKAFAQSNVNQYFQNYLKYYTNTIKNLQDSNLKISVYNLGQYERICSVFGFPKNQQSNGVVCIDLDISVLINDVKMFVNKPQFELSTNQYYYVRPMYVYEQLNNPQIITNFSSTNLTIDLPTGTIKQFSLKDNNLTKKLFQTNYTYTMNIQRLQRTKTYYTIPIVTVNEKNVNDTLLYSIVLNNFANAELSQQSKSSRIAIIMVVPSVVLLLISILITTCILRSIFRKLDLALGLMENYCSLIKRGDLQLEIPEYTESQDLKQMFFELSKLNELNKYCDYAYFNISKPERIIRFLKCRKMFVDLNYDKTNLYQNISECYVEIGDLPKAIQFLKTSINMTIKNIYGKQQQIQRAYQLKISKKLKIDKNARKKKKTLIRKLLKLCQLLFTMHKGKPEIEGQIVEYSELLRKITYPQVLNQEYITSFMFIINFQINNNTLSSKVQQNLEAVYELLKGYEQVYENNQQSGTPPQIMFSYWHSIYAKLKISEQKYLQAYEHCVKGLQGNKFNPMIHLSIKLMLENIFSKYHISLEQLKKFKYFQQCKPRTNRQYIFLIDVSKPEMTTKDVNQWKKKARTVGEHIFDEHVAYADRVSITEFCLDIKIICNLVEKNTRDKILKKELRSSIKARQQTIIGSTVECLKKSIERVKGLKNEKVFIMFLKGKLQINAMELSEQVMQLENSKLILLVETRRVIKQKNQNCYVFEYNELEDIDRVLGCKQIKQADNIVYIF